MYWKHRESWHSLEHYSVKEIGVLARLGTITGCFAAGQLVTLRQRRNGVQL